MIEENHRPILEEFHDILHELRTGEELGREMDAIDRAVGEEAELIREFLRAEDDRSLARERREAALDAGVTDEAEVAAAEEKAAAERADELRPGAEPHLQRLMKLQRIREHLNRRSHGRG